MSPTQPDLEELRTLVDAVIANSLVAEAQSRRARRVAAEVRAKARAALRRAEAVRVEARRLRSGSDARRAG